MTEENNVSELSVQELQHQIKRYDSLVQRLQQVVGQATSQREEYALLLAESQAALKEAHARIQELEGRSAEPLPAPEAAPPGPPPEG